MTTDWMCGTLREDYSTLKRGQLVFYRKVTSARPLAAGVCFWIRPQGLNHYWQIAESFGGPGMRDLIHPKRNPKTGALLLSPPDSTVRLDRELRTFLHGLPKGSRPYPPGTRRPSSIRDTIAI